MGMDRKELRVYSEYCKNQKACSGKTTAGMVTVDDGYTHERANESRVQMRVGGADTRRDTTVYNDSSNDT